MDAQQPAAFPLLSACHADHRSSAVSCSSSFQFSSKPTFMTEGVRLRNAHYDYYIYLNASILPHAAAAFVHPLVVCIVTAAVRLQRRWSSTSRAEIGLTRLSTMSDTGIDARSLVLPATAPLDRDHFAEDPRATVSVRRRCGRAPTWRTTRICSPKALHSILIQQLESAGCPRLAAWSLLARRVRVC